ncbi:hypothetical protein HYE67_008037 [Fusarium culmorum]|uniref:C2H2-type domain-containing protein n=1 Tax=Fusarium culmorum TaxID=5516 RepID=A0A2T4H7F6_FUSCU|nr:hypothetical protein FCULG_00002711 [Fusarium culmorum]QPC65806.1 hypothetical protein HYE67_008037 [Fusarium culmorum]
MQEYASHIPLPDSDASLSEHESDVEIPSGPLNSSEVYVDVQSWLPDPSKDSILGLAGTLFEAILALFTPLARYLANGKDENHSAIFSRGLLQEVERLFLWGDGFSASSGQLDEILSKSSELRQSVLSSIYELGVTLKNTALRTCYTSDSDTPKGLDIPMRELRGLLEQTLILLYHSDDSDDKDAFSESGSSTNDLTECLEDISTYIDCLMDLSVALENPVFDLETVDATIPIFQNLETFNVSSSQALAFCRKIRDRFPKLEKWLVERLGEHNAHRASALTESRERRLEIEAIISEMTKWSLDEPEESVLHSEALFSDGQTKPTEATHSTNLSDPVFDKSNPDSLRRPTPIRRSTHIPASNASFATFASFSTKASAISDGRPRVPPLPEEALEGKPFSCLACHQQFAIKMSRKDWKYGARFFGLVLFTFTNSAWCRRHIFSDLSPYACTVRSCTLENKLYSSTGSWVEHEAQHRFQDWQGSECPFCDKKISLTSPRSYYKHVAEHLREVSLAALPHSSDSDAETSSSDDNSGDDDDWATVSSFSERREIESENLTSSQLQRFASPRTGKRKRRSGVTNSDLIWEKEERRKENLLINPPLTDQERAQLFMRLITKGPESQRGSSLNKILKRFHRARMEANLDTTKWQEEKQLWRDLRLRQNERGEVIVFSAGSQSGRGEEPAAIADKSAEIDGSCADSEAAVVSEKKNKME